MQPPMITEEITHNLVCPSSTPCRSTTADILTLVLSTALPGASPVFNQRTAECTNLGSVCETRLYHSGIRLPRQNLVVTTSSSSGASSRTSPLSIEQAYKAARGTPRTTPRVAGGGERHGRYSGSTESRAPRTWRPPCSMPILGPGF